MTKADNEPVLAKMHVRVDGDDPRLNVTALAKVCQEMCEALHKTPAEGALMLMAAAAHILDMTAHVMAQDKDEEVDFQRLIGAYMQTAANGWNISAMMFRGVTKPELHGVTEVGADDEEDEPKVTLQ